MTMNKRMLLASVVALAGVPGQVNAAASDDEMVVTAAGFSQEKKAAPATISVIDKNALDLKANRNVSEAIADIPGVLVGNGAGTLATGDIRIRGMDSSYTALMVNGVKQRTGESRPYGQDTGAETNLLPPMEAIERIEVIRGPMSSLYGSDAIGGVVNVITRKPYGVEAWTGALAENYFIQENSEFGNTNQVNAFAMGPLIPGKLGLSVAADWLDRRDDDISNYFVKHDRKSVDMTLGLAASDTNLFDLNVVVGEQQKNHTDAAPYEWVFDRDAVTLSHTGWYAQDTIASKNYINYEKGRSRYRYADNAPQYISTENYVANSQTTFTLDSHQLTIGANFTREELNDRFDVASKEAPGLEPVTKITRDGWALFAEDGWEMGDFTLTTSARLDHDNYFGTHITPKLYGNWALADDWTLKGGVSSGYKKPELRATSADFITPRGNMPPYPFLSVGNEDLKPEKSVNSELGLYWTGDTVSLDSTVFYTRFKDKIAEQTICETTDSVQCEYNGYQADSISKYFNVGKADVYGIELNGDWQMAENLKVNTNYTYNHSEQKTGVNKGYALNDYPRHMVNLSLTWSATQALDLWSKANYRSSNRNSGDSAKYDAYTLVDVGARYKVNNNLQLMAGIYNLFDADPKYTTLWAENGVVEGRRYNLGARVEF